MQHTDRGAVRWSRRQLGKGREGGREAAARTHFQGVRCTKATWPPENSTTGSGWTSRERSKARMARGNSARRWLGVGGGWTGVGVGWGCGAWGNQGQPGGQPRRGWQRRPVCGALCAASRPASILRSSPCPAGTSPPRSNSRLRASWSSTWLSESSCLAWAGSVSILIQALRKAREAGVLETANMPVLKAAALRGGAEGGRRDVRQGERAQAVCVVVELERRRRAVRWQRGPGSAGKYTGGGAASGFEGTPAGRPGRRRRRHGPAH